MPAEEKAEHEQRLARMLEELGEALGERERVLEAMKRARTQMRMHRITVEADQPFEEMGGEALADDLQRELEHQRSQERELARVVGLLDRQREIEDRLFEELDRYLVPEHRDELFSDLWRRMERRDEAFEEVAETTLERKRRLIYEVIDRQSEVDDTLYRIIERHLVRLHHPPA